MDSAAKQQLSKQTSQEINKTPGYICFYVTRQSCEWFWAQLDHPGTLIAF